jgi:carbamoyl-phosphate synthase large subunit
VHEAVLVAGEIGFPVMLRPSYVLGGRAMKVVYDVDSLRRFFAEAARISGRHPVLIDQFLEDAVEFDVDAVCDGEDVLIGGIMQHIEEAGVHSGDSFAVYPPWKTSDDEVAVMRDHARRIALELGVVGLMNIQFASMDGKVYVLEINPRASRTVPFLEKATGIDLARVATRCMLGETLARQGVTEAPAPTRVYVKGPVFPFRRFPQTDHLLGPEMKSTGEVMGIGRDFGEAFTRAQLAVGEGLPAGGTAFLSVNDRDKEALVPVARDLAALGFALLGTRGTVRHLAAHGITAATIAKVGEGTPDIGRAIADGGVQLVVNTPLGERSRYDESAIRREARGRGIPCITTLSGAKAAVDGIRALREGALQVKSLQEYHADRRT